MQSPSATISLVDPGALPRIVTGPELANPLPVLRRNGREIKLLAGYSAVLQVVATGEQPLTYSWFRDGALVQSETNGILALQPLHANKSPVQYTVSVRNSYGETSRVELPYSIIVAPTGGWGGTFIFGNDDQANTVFIYDVDGETPLRDGFLAQCYSGISAEYLQPLGAPVRIGTNGVFGPLQMEMCDVQAGDPGVIQIKAWDAAKGQCYEQARDAGGKFGSSVLLTIVTGGKDGAPPARLQGFTSFSVREGLTATSRARFRDGHVSAEGTPQWKLISEPGVYMIESRILPHDWMPLQFVTNRVGSTVFLETKKPSAPTFYRARRYE